MAGKYCPDCGNGTFSKDRIGGADSLDVVCSACKGTYAPGELIEDVSQQTCKKCKRFIPQKQAHIVAMKKDFPAGLKKGFIHCPHCKAKHHAIKVRISES